MYAERFCNKLPYNGTKMYHDEKLFSLSTNASYMVASSTGGLRLILAISNSSTADKVASAQKPCQ